jgi:hypothetical protein
VPRTRGRYDEDPGESSALRRCSFILADPEKKPVIPSVVGIHDLTTGVVDSLSGS